MITLFTELKKRICELVGGSRLLKERRCGRKRLLH